MKKILLALLAFIIVNSLLAQYNYSISGKVILPQRSYIVFKHYDKYFFTYKFDTLELNENGEFNFSGNSNSISISGYLEITAKQELEVWCAASEKLIVTIKDTSSNPVFSGTLGKINQYLIDDNKYRKKIYTSYEEKHSNFNSLRDFRTDEYFKITDSITTDRIAFLENTFNKMSADYEKNFVTQQKNKLIYSDLYLKLSYNNPPLEKFTLYQTHFNKKNPTSYKFSDQINFNDTTLLNNGSFLGFSRSFFMELVFRFQKENNIKLSREEFYDKVFFYINQLSNNELCNSLFKAFFVNVDIQSFMLLNENTTEFSYRRFVDSLLTYQLISTQAKLVEENFNKKLNELIPLKAGANAPDCLLTDTAKHSLSLDSFKGKLLYIDVWASWCGKCIQAIPAWNRLVEKYKNNNNVAFITIYVDEDKEEWLQLLYKHKPVGVHFISEGGQNSEFAKKFYIYALPRNILIDKDGHIIDIHAQSPDVIDLSTYLD